MHGRPSISHPCLASDTSTSVSTITCPVSDATNRTCARPFAHAINVTPIGATPLAVDVAVAVAVDVAVVVAVDVAESVPHVPPSGTRWSLHSIRTCWSVGKTFRAETTVVSPTLSISGSTVRSPVGMGTRSCADVPDGQAIRVTTTTVTAINRVWGI